MVARLGEEVIKLEVPMKVDVNYGRTWGDAKHTWDELHGKVPQPRPVEIETPITIDPQPMPLAAATVNIGPPPPPPPPPPPSPPPSPPPGGNGRGDNSGFDGDYRHERRDGYPHGERASGRKVTEFVYHDLKGAPYLRVEKYVSAQGDKSFPQYRFDNGKWIKRGKNWPSIPYRLPELLAAPTDAPVEVCEGEKDADNLAKLGLIATTNPGGAGKWTPELNKWFTGFARANVYEDNDTPGHRHADTVARELLSIIGD